MASSHRSSISALLKKYNLRPRKGLGQNFLTDPVHLARIVEAAELKPEDTVLEVGPGLGALTRLLARTAGRVIAVELDPNLVELLQTEYHHLDNLIVVEADILQADIETLLTQLPASDPRPVDQAFLEAASFKVVANLPYYITSAIIRRLLEAAPQPNRLVLTVQKEVAHRIVAEPGRMSVLAVSVQFYGRPRLVHYIPAGAFYPPPKVDSAVVCIDAFTQPPVAVADVAYFFQVVKAGFSQKRKQLKNALAGGLRKSSGEVVRVMEGVHIAPTRRAETLTLAEWGRLAEALAGPD